MAVRCPFCSTEFHGTYPDKEIGVHTLKCESCHRAFIVWVRKQWWGYSREVRVR